MNPRRLLLSTALAACASMGYELCLAHLSSILFGGTVWRYNLAVSLYVGGLGIGALGPPLPLKKLIQTEWLLTCSGLIAPALILSVSHELAGNLVFAFCTGWIGYWSGRELPALIQLAPQDSGRVLFADYFGALVGALGFALLLLPGVGLLGTLLVYCWMSFAAAALLLFSTKVSLAKLALGVAVLAAISAGVLHSGEDLARRVWSLYA